MNKSSLSHSRDTTISLSRQRDSSFDKLNNTEIYTKQPSQDKHIGSYIAKKIIHSSLTAHSKSSKATDSKTIKSFTTQQDSFQVPTLAFSSIANSSYLVSDQGNDIQSIDDFISKLNKIFYKASEDRPQVQENYTQLMKAFKKFDLKAEIDKNMNKPISPSLYIPVNRKNSYDSKSSIEASRRICASPDIIKMQPEERIRILEKQEREYKAAIEELEKLLQAKEKECQKLTDIKTAFENESAQLKKKLETSEEEILRMKRESAKMMAEHAEKEQNLKHSLVL